jgi:hypothetical protein
MEVRVGGGGRVKGRVLLSVQKEIPADCLMLAFNGIERCIVKMGKDTTMQDRENIVSSEEILGEFPFLKLNCFQFWESFRIIFNFSSFKHSDVTITLTRNSCRAVFRYLIGE